MNSHLTRFLVFLGICLVFALMMFLYVNSNESREVTMPKIEQNVVKKSQVSCDLFMSKTLEEKKYFCANVENKECEYCKPSCANYEYLSEEKQKSYCKNKDTNCKKCPPSESQNASRIQNGDTKSESETTQIDCSHLDGISGTQLENLCKNIKNKSCEKCKNINKK